MPNAGKLVWYARRLAAMSPMELAHRLVEQGKRRADRAKNWSWDAFGDFDGPVGGPPGLAGDLSDADAERANTAARDVVAGRLRFLSQDWPEPERSDWWNGPDVWFLDPVSGLRWPGAEAFAFDVPYRHDHVRGDVKFVWEINRLQFLPALAARSEVGPGAALDVLKGWMAANPPYRGINWTGGIEAASRLMSVLAMLTYLDRRLSAEVARQVRAFIEAHARWIDRYPSLHSSANNHRVAELAALFIAGVAAPGMASSSRYRSEGRAGLEREILNQFHADGVGAEQSPTYAAYSLEWFVLAGRAAEASGEPMSRAYRDRAAAAAEHLRWMVDDSGHAPRIGDDDEGRVLSFDLAQASDYPQTIATMAKHWLGSAKPMPSTSLEGVRTFRGGGYTVSRAATSQGTALFVFDHAPLGFLSIAAHGHADALAVWLNWGDEPVLVDAGTYLYHAGRDERDTFRGTLAHNTLALDGQDQSRISGPFNWADHAAARLIEASENRVVAEQGGYLARHGLVHRRSVDFRASGYMIEDRLIGTAKSAALPWRIGYLLHPDVHVELDGAVARLTTPAGRELGLICEAGPDWMLEEGDYSPGFNRRTSTRRLVLSGSFRREEEPVASRVAIILGKA